MENFQNKKSLLRENYRKIFFTPSIILNNVRVNFMQNKRKNKNNLFIWTPTLNSHIFFILILLATIFKLFRNYMFIIQVFIIKIFL